MTYRTGFPASIAQALGVRRSSHTQLGELRSPKTCVLDCLSLAFCRANKRLHDGLLGLRSCPLLQYVWTCSAGILMTCFRISRLMKQTHTETPRSNPCGDPPNPKSSVLDGFKVESENGFKKDNVCCKMHVLGPRLPLLPYTLGSPLTLEQLLELREPAALLSPSMENGGFHVHCSRRGGSSRAMEQQQGVSTRSEGHPEHCEHTIWGGGKLRRVDPLSAVAEAMNQAKL